MPTSTDRASHLEPDVEVAALAAHGTVFVLTRGAPVKASFRMGMARLEQEAIAATAA